MEEHDLAKLVVRMEAQADKYLRDLEKQRDATKKWRDKTSKDVKSVRDEFKKLATTATVVAVTAGLKSMVNQATVAAREIKNLSLASGQSVETFQAQAYAANTAGISAEKFADIMKDARERVGDFIATGAGPLTDFFENVAPKIGVTAQELQNLSGSEVLVRVKQAMDNANVSMEEQIFYLESIASDTTFLIPLLKDNGRELNRLAKEYDNLGLAISQADIDELTKLERINSQLESSFIKLKVTMTKDVGPAIIEVFNLISNAVSGVVDVTKWASEEISSIFNGPAMDDIVRIEEQIKKVQDLLDDDGLFAAGSRLRFFGPDGLVKFYSREELEQEVKRLEQMAATYWENAKAKNDPANDIVIDSGVNPRQPTDTTGDKNALDAFTRLQESLLTEEEAYALSFQRRLDIIKNALGREADLKDEAAELTRRLAKEKVDYEIAKEKELSDKKQALALSVLDVGIAVAKEDSGIQRGLLAIKKVAAMREAAMNLKLAMSEALATPWPQNIGAIGTVASIGAGIVSDISGMSSNIPSFFGGGQMPSGVRSLGIDGKGGMPAILHDSEIVFDPKSSNSSGLMPSIEVHNYSGQPVETMTEDNVIRIIVGQMSNTASESRIALHSNSNVVPKGIR